MATWLGMGSGFLFGYFIGFFNKKIAFAIKSFRLSPGKTTHSNQDRVVYRKRMIFVLSVLTIFVLVASGVFLLLGWSYKIISMNIIKDFAVAFFILIILGFLAGWLVKERLDKVTGSRH